MNETKYKYGNPPGHATLAVLRYLKENGPSTRAELCRALDGNDKRPISGVLTRLNNKRIWAPKRVYICDWIYDDEGYRNYPRAVYALGDKEDKKKPKISKTEHNRRYRENNKGQRSSVWDLATHVKDLRVKGLKDRLEVKHD